MAKITQDQKTMGMLSHLLGLFTGFIGPLIMFLIYKEKKDFVYENAKHALNFQISLIIYMIVSGILMIILIGFLLAVAVGIFALVVEIIGSVRAYEGKVYKYPLEIPFIK